MARLIFERDHGSIATAKSGHFHQAPMGLGHGHDRSVAIYGVPGGGEVPLTSLVLGRLLGGRGVELGWGRQPGDGERQN
jgi:hypothetical protein